MLDVQADIVRSNQNPKTEVNYVAQLMSGVRDPNDTSKERGLPFTARDFELISKTIHTVITPSKEIFAQLQAGFAAIAPDDVEAQNNYLHNANIFIRQLILNSPEQGIELNRSLQVGVTEFLQQKSQNPQLASVFEEIENNAKDALRIAKETKIQRLETARERIAPGRTSLDSFIHGSLAKSSRGLDENVQAFAADLLESNLHLLRKVASTDLYNKKWTRDASKEAIVERLGLLDVMETFNITSQMVAQDILLAQSEKHQKRIVEFYVKAAEICLKNGDFEGANQINSAFVN
ncbi:MAG: hypothetical protein HYX61_13795 [Gammaproteobacteria bacterium]|jgi:hypothetical protein|nr:hypothetical protein [Gammaproteobacteria bacterium]